MALLIKESNEFMEKFKITKPCERVPAPPTPPVIEEEPKKLPPKPVKKGGKAPPVVVQEPVEKKLSDEFIKPAQTIYNIHSFRQIGMIDPF